ncbi:hypothetical protein J0H58_36455 [bacterium]|nr:hypothetical protein [bacterium]
MSNRTDSDPEESDWSELEDDVLARVKYVARRIVERVQKAMEGTRPGRRLGPDDPTDEVPVL